MVSSLHRVPFRTLSMLAVVALALAALHCGNSTGQECDVCTTDADCTAAGLVCRPFPEDGSLRCASGTGATQCRKPLF